MSTHIVPSNLSGTYFKKLKICIFEVRLKVEVYTEILKFREKKLIKIVDFETTTLQRTDSLPSEYSKIASSYVFKFRKQQSGLCKVQTKLSLLFQKLCFRAPQILS